MDGPDQNQIKQIVSDQAMKVPEQDKMKASARIELRKKTMKELEEMATARSGKDAKDDDDEEDEANYPLPHICPSEYSLKELNTQLTVLPVVRAFNSAEGKIRKKKQSSK